MKKLHLFASVFLALLVASCGGSGITPDDDPVNDPGDNPGTQVDNQDSDAVDLGLSVKWAKMNIGATAPSDYGDYFAWGETSTKKEYTLGTYKWNSASTYYWLTKYVCDSSWGTVDNKTELDPEDDAARVILGGKWRMPTQGEMFQLAYTKDHNPGYKWEWKTISGHSGWEVTYLKNGNSIFLPAAGAIGENGISEDSLNNYGYYWTSTNNRAWPSDAFALHISENTAEINSTLDRDKGLVIRPVCD